MALMGRSIYKIVLEILKDKEEELSDKINEYFIYTFLPEIFKEHTKKSFTSWNWEERKEAEFKYSDKILDSDITKVANEFGFQCSLRNDQDKRYLTLWVSDPKCNDKRRMNNAQCWVKNLNKEVRKERSELKILAKENAEKILNSLIEGTFRLENRTEKSYEIVIKIDDDKMLENVVYVDFIKKILCLKNFSNVTISPEEKSWHIVIIRETKS